MTHGPQILFVWVMVASVLDAAIGRLDTRRARVFAAIVHAVLFFIAAYWGGFFS